MESKAMERNKTSHVAQIEAHVRIEAAQDLHDQLVAMRLPRAERWAGLYGRARALLTLGHDTDALRELDAYERELFPEDLEFLPARFYGEGRNE
jgi:hypothetical protein